MDYLTVRGYLLPLPDDGDDIAAIAGDFVANVRSALDHICVALTGRDDAQFPVFEQDIWQPDIDPRTGSDRNKTRRDSFKKWTRGMPPAALARINAVQPHAASPQSPELNPLALLTRISNADKHRTLMVISGNMFHPTVTVRIPGVTEPVVISERREKGDGAALASIPVSWQSDITPDVQAGGGIKIALKEAPSLTGAWEMPGVLESVISYARFSVIDFLEQYVT
ncbi:MAG TPA: hypothetical protein VN840_04420 [Streptosporangiaceae bacterium]|nr:hypothetical protein [Streptosporangiaceae bacterium]